MFTDLALSADAMAQYARARPHAAHRLAAFVLEQGSWPFVAREQAADIVLPNNVCDWVRKIWGEADAGERRCKMS
jgi:hypothetical protein